MAMGRRLLSLAFGCALIFWGAAAMAQSRNKTPYQPDAIPRMQYDKSVADQLSAADKTRGKEYFLAIYSGSTLGTYFYIASGLCKVIEANFAEHRIHCVPLRSQGVNSNIELMNQGRAQFIIIQTDTNRDAANGKIKLPDGRSVMSLHDEMGLIAVRPDSDIRSVADLRGKRVNLGPEGTASRALWEELLKIEGIGQNELRRVYSVQQDLNDEGLCDNFIDAYGLWIGHPTPAIGQAVEKCGARVVGMSSPAIDAYVAEHPYYTKKTIPAGTYSNQTEPLESYGFKGSLVVNRNADPYIVYWAVKSVAENIDYLREQHPSLATVNAREMFEKGNFLPFHPGAAKYWREAGFLTDTPAVN